MSRRTSPFSSPPTSVKLRYKPDLREPKELNDPVFTTNRCGNGPDILDSSKDSQSASCSTSELSDSSEPLDAPERKNFGRVSLDEAAFVDEALISTAGWPGISIFQLVSKSERNPSEML